MLYWYSAREAATTITLAKGKRKINSFYIISQCDIELLGTAYRAVIEHTAVWEAARQPHWHRLPSWMVCARSRCGTRSF